MPSSAWIRWVKGCLNSHKWGGKDVEEVSIQYKFHDRWQISFYWRRFYFLTLFSFALLSNKMIKPITNARGTVLLCNSLCFYNGNRGSYDNIQFTTVLIFQNQRVLMSRVCWSIKLLVVLDPPRMKANTEIALILAGAYNSSYTGPYSSQYSILSSTNS